MEQDTDDGITLRLPRALAPVGRAAVCSRGGGGLFR
jgi:hypothetical protein